MEFQFEQILSGLDVVVWSTDAQSREIFYCSEGILSVYGYPPEVFLKKPSICREVVHEVSSHW
jgi:hypothetical protein